MGLGSCSGLCVVVMVVIIAALLAVPGNLDWALSLGPALRALYGMQLSDFDNFLGSYDVFDEPQNDSRDEDKVNKVYKILVPLMGLGSLTKFYIPPVMDESRKGYRDLNYNQILIEQKMADALSLGPGKVALDIGCGAGRIADTIQDYTGAKIVGINISPEQLATARSNAERKGKLGSTLEFNRVSMNDDPLPFPDDTFDAVYVMQAITYVHDPVRLMREVRRILKPGGMFGDLSIVTLDKYNPSNQTQYSMLQNAKRVGVIPTFRPRQVYENACTSNDFSLLVSKNLGHAEMTQSATDFFTPLGTVVQMLHKVGLVGSQVMASMDRMNQYAKDLIEGGREELFSINYWIVCQAPL